MAKAVATVRKVKTKKPVKRSRLAEDLFASLDELRDYVAGKPTKVIAHTVIPSDTDARIARHKLGLSQREFGAVIGTGVSTVRKWEFGTRRPSGAARSRIRRHRDMLNRAVYWTCEGLGYALCELAFRTDCRGPFAWCYRAGCWSYGKATDIVPP